jgi:hypothetical protein
MVSRKQESDRHSGPSIITVISVADRPDRGEDVVVVQELGVVERRVCSDSTGRRNILIVEVFMGRPAGWMKELTGRIGDAYDNGMMEAFWARMQTELLNRKRWRTRLELANAIFEYLEVFHNRKRRHGSLGMLTPTEYETLHHNQPTAA